MDDCAAAIWWLLGVLIVKMVQVRTGHSAAVVTMCNFKWVRHGLAALLVCGSQAVLAVVWGSRRLDSG
jgi:hypothetical protein